MASHRDLLDAIARVRAAGGELGLSGTDIAVATNPLSSPGAVGAVLAKVIAAHPAVFRTVPVPGDTAERAEGEAAEAIRAAESELAQRQSAATQADLRVLDTVLDARTGHGQGIADLDRLRRDIEAAAAGGDRDTPAGARAFQSYLVDKLREIQEILRNTGLQSDAKAAVAGAIAALYASASDRETVAVKPDSGMPGDGDSGPSRDDTAAGKDDCADEDSGSEPSTPGEPIVDPWPALGEDLAFPPAPEAPVPAAAPAPMPSMAAPGSGWGSGLPGAPFGGSSGALMPPSLPRLGADPVLAPSSPEEGPEEGPEPEPDAAEEDGERDGPAPDATTVELPDGETLTAPSPDIAAAIRAAVAGTPIAEAFAMQGITLPAPGSAVATPVGAESLVAGDVGMFVDRHALALGNGKVLLDGQIQPLGTVTGPGFLGWQHPPAPDDTVSPTVPEPPAPTAPS